MTFKEDYLELKFDDCTALLKKLPNSSETVGCNCIIFYGCLCGGNIFTRKSFNVFQNCLLSVTFFTSIVL